MKIAVLNTSGNVGKSTIVREVLYPRMSPDCLALEVESYNSSNSAFNINTQKLAGDTDFEIFYEKMVSDEDVIFDIGASEISNFFDSATEYAGAIQAFDYFVIPTISDSKMMEDTAKTINFLRSQEIAEEKIKVVFNQVNKSVETEFKALLNFDFCFDLDLFIKKSNFFKDLSLLKMTFIEVYNPDKKFYKEKMLAAKDPVEKKKYLKKDLLNMGAEKKIKELDFVFEHITGQEVNLLDRDFSFSAAKEEEKTNSNNTSEDTEIGEDDEEL